MMQTPHQSLWVKQDDPRTIEIIDQRSLPHEVVIEELNTLEDVATALREMHVRGAPLIGVAAAYGMYLAACHVTKDQSFQATMEKAALTLKATRPTAVNLQRAVDRQRVQIQETHSRERGRQRLFEEAQRIREEDIEICRKIGEHGVSLIHAIARKKKKTVNVLTHCNAGWLACIDWGTATSSIYQAFEQGVDLHVWVNETRPRVQGASLTAWELSQRRIPHTVIVDNASGHLMRQGRVDLIMVGTDRTTATGDVANKIGTYLIALSAQDNNVPFYVALPSTSIDWTLRNGFDIPIEERAMDEVTQAEGFLDGERKCVQLTPEGTPAANYAFDVTPHRLISGFITERGIAPGCEEGLLQLFPERKAAPHDG